MPAIEYRGTVVLLVDSNYVIDLKTEIDRLEMDLIGDGWRIIRHDISRGTSVSDIRDLIIADKTATPELSTVFLLGHIPVPYSGNINPDAHGDHLGAWPADLYYGEIDGSWTDASINNVTASRDENDNIPGDGKFDQSVIPSDVDLEVGRVDLYNMPAFALSDVELIRQYLNKNHDFRHAILKAEKRALIDDNFKSYDEGFAQTGWRYFSAMFGADNVSALDFLGTLATESYLWAYGCGGGSYTSCGGIGKTTDIAATTIKAVFTPLFGSYFGDWDAQNNFLRAPLAAPTSPLATFWAGRPHWHIHHMDLGKHIGYSTRLTQNNSSLYPAGYGARWVHVALMGDPTLSMHIVEPATSLKADSVGNVTVQLNWTASADPDILGYEIFRANSLKSKFEKINSNLVIGNSYLDEASLNGNNVYMIRAMKLQVSGSGSFYQLSQGIFDSTSTNWPTSLQEKEAQAIVSTYPNPTKDELTVLIKRNQAKDVQISLSNAVGQQLYHNQLQDAQNELIVKLRLAEYGKGIYFLNINSDATTSIRKIIVE